MLSYGIYTACKASGILLFFNLHQKTCLLILERGRGKERESERNMEVTSIHQLPLVHTRTRDKICNPGRCLTKKGTQDRLVHGTMLQSSHTDQDCVILKDTCSKPGINIWHCLSHSYRYQDMKEKIRALISMPFSHICKYFTSYFRNSKFY